jgi:hypothetical protein
MECRELLVSSLKAQVQDNILSICSRQKIEFETLATNIV